VERLTGFSAYVEISQIMTVSIRAEALEKLSHQRSMESGMEFPTSVGVVVALSTEIH
jgi:hypothetical protein